MDKCCFFMHPCDQSPTSAQAHLLPKSFIITFNIKTPSYRPSKSASGGKIYFLTGVLALWAEQVRKYIFPPEASPLSPHQ